MFRAPCARAPCAHHQEVKTVLHSIWYRHTCRWSSGAQVASGHMKFLMAVAVKVAVFGDVMPCSLADIHWRFRTIFCPLIRWNNIYPKYDSNRCLWNVGKYVSEYMIWYWWRQLPSQQSAQCSDSCLVVVMRDVCVAIAQWHWPSPCWHFKRYIFGQTERHQLLILYTNLKTEEKLAISRGRTYDVM